MMADEIPFAERLVDLASVQVGIKEATGKNDGEPSARYCGGREEPWCAHFVAWLFRSLGQPLPGDVVPTPKRANPIASVKTMFARCQKAGFVMIEPKPGDIIFFNSRGDSDAGSGWHVGIVSTVADGWVQTIEGNSGDAVHRRGYDLKNKRIIGFARPTKKASNPSGTTVA